MKCRTQLVNTMPERLTRHPFLFPVYKNGEYPGWKVDLGFRLLELIGCSRVRLDYRRLPVQKAAQQYGMAKLLRSEEHTSELQSLMRISYAVFCLKKKNNIAPIISTLL